VLASNPMLAETLVSRAIGAPASSELAMILVPVPTENIWQCCNF
jgi:hypothetical protein